MKFLKASLFTASKMSASVSHAKAPPLVVCTVSFQPPVSVFSAAMTSVGTEKDPNRFLAGKGRSGERSAYLPLTEAMDHAMNISEALTRDKPHGTVYVYDVRPTKNFYNVVDSLRFAEEILPQGGASQELSDIWFSTRCRVAGEWAADTTISNQQIIGVRTFSWHDDVPELSALSPNPNYISALSDVSQRPMPPRNTSIDAVEVAKNGMGIDFIPASFAEMACASQHPRRAASLTSLCLPLKRLSASKPHEQTVAKMILTNIFSISGSGRIYGAIGPDEHSR